MFVHPCILVQFIKKNPKIQNDATVYQNFIIPYLYKAQHVSGDTPPIIRSLKLHWQPLVFHTWKVVERVAGGPCQANTVPDNVHQLHVQQTSTYKKTRGCQCRFRLLMMGGVSPETCWAYVEVCWTCSWWTFSGTYCAWQRPPTTRPTNFHVWKTRGCQCSFRLLMIGGVSPETCWASYKYGTI